MSRHRGHPPVGPWIEHTTRLKVRFHEVDILAIAWHGHYFKWFEVGREAFGEAYGLGFADFVEAGTAAPVVHACADYLAPARHGDELDVRVRLHACEAARIELSYEISRTADGLVLARGHTSQALTDAAGNLHLNVPPILQRFYERWGGQLKAPAEGPRRSGGAP